MTRRKGAKAETDTGLKSLLDSGEAVIALVGKTSAFHATEVLRTTLDENLAMIRDSVAYLVRAGREVIFDAEHFYDAWKQNRDYALSAVEAAAEAGARLVVLCDTNGGSMTDEVAEITAATVPGCPCRSAFTFITIAIWRWPTRSRASRPGPCWSKVRSTGSASAAAMPT